MSNLEDESSGLETNPFRLTRQERESLDPNYKKPKKKVRSLIKIRMSDCGVLCLTLQRNKIVPLSWHQSHPSAPKQASKFL